VGGGGEDNLDSNAAGKRQNTQGEIGHQSLKGRARGKKKRKQVI